MFFDIVNQKTALASRGSPDKESTMTTSEKEYLAWINGGLMGTSWRADTIREAVRTCTIIAAEDWGGLRGHEVPVAVYEVNGSRVTLDGGRGEVLTEKGTELPPLSIIKIDIPTVRKNGTVYGKSYRNKVQKAADTALHNVIGN